MNNKRMLQLIFLFMFFPALAFSAVPITSGNYGDAFNVDVNLSKGNPSPIIFENESNDSVWYELPDEENYQLDVSNSSIVCPSNQCRITSYTEKKIFHYQYAYA